MAGFRPQFWPTVMTVPALFLLLGLGAWQIRRLEWKDALIARREAAVAAPVVAAPQTLAGARRLEYHPVTVEGEFLNDKEIYLAASAGAGSIGYRVLTPLAAANGGIVFIDRGYIPTRLKDPKTRAAGQLAGRRRIVGLLRLPPDGRPNWFLPDNRPDLDYWFWVDLPAMAAADKLASVAPFYIDADATPNPGGWPKGSVPLPELPNHHLQYAITWFSLAAALAVIYFLFHRRRAGPG